MMVARYRSLPPSSGSWVMSPTHFVFTSVVVKSRPSRSGAFAAAGSAIVVAVPATQPDSCEIDDSHDAGNSFVVDPLAVVAEFGGDPGNAVGAVRLAVRRPYPGREQGIGGLAGGPFGGRHAPVVETGHGIPRPVPAPPQTW